MYRVIIADDEPDICAGMKTLIDWDALGFEVAGTAENGLQAMELEEELKKIQNKPDGEKEPKSKVGRVKGRIWKGRPKNEKTK